MPVCRVVFVDMAPRLSLSLGFVKAPVTQNDMARTRMDQSLDRVVGDKFPHVAQQAGLQCSPSAPESCARYDVLTVIAGARLDGIFLASKKDAWIY